MCEIAAGAVESTTHDVPDLPKAMEQGHELGTPALLQIYVSNNI